MAHFGVVAPAFYSHFSALGALAGELVARGHRVSFVHRPDAAAYVRALLGACQLIPRRGVGGA